MKKTSIVALLTAMSLIVTTSMAYAYWTSGYSGATASHTTSTVNIGAASVVATTLTVGGESAIGTSLVPVGVTPEVGQVNAITFTVNVAWTNNEAPGASSALVMDCTEIWVDGTKLDSENPDCELFMFTKDVNTVTGNNTPVPVTITVTMNTPSDAAQYARVAGKQLKFTFEFSVGA